MACPVQHGDLQGIMTGLNQEGLSCFFSLHTSAQCPPTEKADLVGQL